MEKWKKIELCRLAFVISRTAIIMAVLLNSFEFVHTGKVRHSWRVIMAVAHKNSIVDDLLHLISDQILHNYLEISRIMMTISIVMLNNANSPHVGHVEPDELESRNDGI